MKNLNLDKSTWRRVRFGDVARNVNESIRDPKNHGINRVIAMEHMDPGKLAIDRWGNLEDGTSFSRRVKPGQTLFGKRRAYQRKVSFAEFDAICSGDILTFESDETGLLAEFLPFLVQSDAFFDHALGTSAGSLSPRTNWRDLAKFEFDLPPLEAQRRLGTLLWSLVQHRQALYRTRTDTRLTRSAYIDECVRTTSKRSPIRSFARLDEQPVQVGPFGGTLASRHFTEEGVRVLKIQNVSSTNQIDLDYSVFVSEEHAASLDRYRLRKGDTVIVAQGATVGKTAIVNDDVGNAIISQHLIRVRLDPTRVIPEFAALMIQSADFQRQIDTVRTKSTRDGLNTNDVAKFVIPDLSLKDQAQLVEQVNTFDEADHALSTEQEAITKVQQVLLAEIFGGH